ncbi:GATA zinc finger domain-containing protein 8 isoform X15 [Microplitis mediator]|uniref:GATA zinc finger domain-containing protein 8 isoform X15 n=1 Tax=Microplitis mediator TaxID=375433 RepID=UPI002552AB0A|nr:GATA zinc finger domain-containing protein 8 isoform X15 [Microplitis mediator]
MLNCTDLECILHHHYYYAHLHQLQQPPIDNAAFSTAAEDVENGVKSQDNKTDSPQSSSHLDPPLDTLYMIGGLMIATALVGVIIILIAVTISKLRKREDNANDHQVNSEPAVVQTATSACNNNNNINNNNNNYQANGNININGNGNYNNNLNLSNGVTTGQMLSSDIRNNGIVNPAASITVSEINGIVDGTIVTEANDQLVWQFPPPYPPPLTPPPQYTLYNDQNTLVHGLQGDRHGFAKGIRKNLGRWRRLVKRKSDIDTCAIPPELKDQLKTIYVY